MGHILFQRYGFSVRENGKVTVVGILQNTIIFANNEEDEDNMDRECQEKNESAASNYVFQCSQWQHVIMPLLNFTDGNYFISITGKPNDANRHHLPHCLSVL